MGSYQLTILREIISYLVLEIVQVPIVNLIYSPIRHSIIIHHGLVVRHLASQLGDERSKLAPDR